MGKTKNAKERFWQDYGYVARGKQRRQVINAMERPMSVTQIKTKAGLSLSETSRVLRGFAKQRLATCITPEQLTGRIYTLTTMGKRIREELAKTSS
jgi:predicted transcriptional regulator